LNLVFLALVVVDVLVGWLVVVKQSWLLYVLLSNFQLKSNHSKLYLLM